MKWLNNFITHLVLERNLSKNTADSYSSDINQFFDFTKKRLQRVTSEDVGLFIISLREQGYNVSSTNRKLSAIRTFYKFLLKKGVVKINPAELIDSGKSEKRLPKPVDQEDIDKLINAADNLRDKVIFELLFATGMRREEIRKVKVSDINFTRGFVRVIGKGNKERIVPIHPSAMNMVKELADSQTSEWLFPSRKNKDQCISNTTIFDIFNKWIKVAGLEGKNITPHKFRHAFATALHENGADVLVLQNLLGHNSVSTTQIYTKVSMERNRGEYMKFHPKAKARN